MPNTHVPAAGEAMPAAEGMQIITGRFSRRAMLIGAASVPTVAGAVALPMPLPASDPLADLIAEYYAKADEFAAIPDELITRENEDTLVDATYGPARYRLWKDTPQPTTLRGVAEALRYAIREDGFIDHVAENVIKASLAFLDREAGL
ncbi:MULTISPECIES: hypothetical protein [unclassified Mesorhizobium]|uniref:hypothetical protein n=1 Tax=unclassified Mesorhizobium TaxID=325217 RepID=UPI000FCB32F1|nr:MULTISPECIES: hypothetical protein [unclassified Mesorhizobium]TIT79858.1 MAG: hypothetical protein E5W57_05245 [Mesorhizobium sp.]TGP26416.1 hypothetical protein EN874_001695 [Mesorhizobium sp. M1D.F.Ca.ET.231.01.1.1]TGP38374.1 hypothetical protein EN877_01695 [Mesorhizobium sp. M1D.F.Ca.ET.234.01.1.1]TGS50584.1 hypothetical protein EN827_01695 [Mesorhizobium sp. M1D.F.Ca.ET.184.01.1.1]TGS66469.1 hypothetical protein EN826_001695 [Mesorhizobium sp. M1D.F.Ca.ET.183.01.1.1]